MALTHRPEAAPEPDVIEPVSLPIEPSVAVTSESVVDESIPPILSPLIMPRTITDSKKPVVSESVIPETASQPQNERAPKKERSIDIDKAAAIIGIFVQPGMHVQQLLEPRVILSKLKHAGFDTNERTVKFTARRLQDFGLMKVTVANRNKGGHRSSSQQSLKIGLLSQEIKQMLEKMSKEGDVQAYIAKLVQVQTIAREHQPGATAEPSNLYK